MRDMDDIRAFCTEFRKYMEHAPGPEWADVDEEQWRRLIDICKRISDRGVRFRGDDKQGWIAEAWQVFFFIRNSEFRPKWDRLEDVIREKFKAQLLPGHEADVRRDVRQMRTRDETLAVGGSAQRMLGQAFSDDVPEWLDEFPSRDNGGAFDQTLLRPMMHLSDYEARKVIQIIKTENARWEREKSEREAGPKINVEAKKRDADRLRKTVQQLQQRAKNDG